MSIWERMARVARSELSEMKRVLADRDLDPASEAATREAAIAEAEAELARAEQDVLSAQIEMGAAGWGDARSGAGTSNAASPPPAAQAGQDDAIARGASLWGSGPSAQPAATGGAPAVTRGPVIDATHTTPAPAAEPAGRAPASTGAPRAISKEIREAYAALELPLGADADAVRGAHAALAERFHPDRFGGDEARERIAAMVKARIDEARDQLLTWLGPHA